MASSEPTYTLSALFSKYRDDALLNKLESYALWTIPSVFPSEVDAAKYQNADIEYDCQSKGALLVNRLATKLARTLFPANTSFFRIEINDEIKELFKQQQIDDVIAYENKACSRIFLNASYAQLVQAMRLLIVTGECLLFRKNNAIRVYSLRNYTVKRNNVGEVLDIVIRELKYYSELPDNVKELIPNRLADDELKLFTRCTKQANGTWQVKQEIDGVDIGTDTVYRKDLCPYVPVTWNHVNGDNYGRGYVEDFAADLYKYSELSRSLTDYEFEALKLIHLVDPAVSFDVEAAEKAVSGDYIHGKPEGVQPYEAGDYQKMLQVMNDLKQIEQRLDIAFMYMGNSREGERVTAYEIRQNAEEAEHVLGGVYSQLSQNMHLPLAYLLLDEENNTIIYELDAGNLKLNILTGLQALSRSSENQNLVIASSEMNAVLPVFMQLGLDKIYNLEVVAESILQSNGVNTKNIKFTEAQLKANAEAAQKAAEQQQMQQAQLTAQPANQESAVDALQNSRMM